MLPLNYALLKLFENAKKDMCAYDVMEALKVQYSDFRAFKESYVAEALMCGQFNGILDETSYELDSDNKLRIYYQANEEGKNVIKKYIKG